jgi:hypothetical protein
VVRENTVRGTKSRHVENESELGEAVDAHRPISECGYEVVLGGSGAEVWICGWENIKVKLK